MHNTSITQSGMVRLYDGNIKVQSMCNIGVFITNNSST